MLGHPGLTDLTVLIGYFVSLTLVAYGLPSSATGLDHEREGGMTMMDFGNGSETTQLGGRLPLLQPAKLSPEQTRLYCRVEADLVQ